jgi:GTP-binding protein
MYIQYLKNCIRRDLGFTMIPVEVDLRNGPAIHRCMTGLPRPRR